MHFSPPSQLIAALLMLTLGSAQAPCWQGDELSGELRFSGQVEDERFTGQFGDFVVRVCRPEGSGWQESRWSVRVATASADTHNRDRDDTLHGQYFFAVDDFPTANWTSTAVRETNGRLVLEGELELRGFTASQSVQVDVDSSGQTLVLEGMAEIARLEFGVGQGEYADTGFIRDRVDLEFDLRLTPQ